MRNSLCAKRKLGFVDGSITKPKASTTSSPTLEDWYMVNSMLLCWVIQSIDFSVRSSVTYFDNVKDLSDDLRQRFCVGNGPRKFQLLSELPRCHQSGSTVAAYHDNLKILWDEFAGAGFFITFVDDHFRHDGVFPYS